MKVKFSYRYLLSLNALLLVLLIGCFGGGGAPQVSGIVAVSNFETIACVPQEKTFQIRNNNTEEPQRIQGVLFELGTNEFDETGQPPNPEETQQKRNERKFVPYYKIVEVATEGKEPKKVIGNLEEEIILPPGGILSVKVSYKPKYVTRGEERHRTYLDLILNGPKLGVMQIEMDGKAESMLEGCGATSLTEFSVVEVKTIISHKDLPREEPQPLDPSAITGNFKFDIDEANGKVTLPVEGWPIINIPLPQPISGTNAISIQLVEDAEGTFTDGEMLFDDTITLKVAGIIDLPNITLSTGEISMTSGEAPNILETLSLAGSKLNDQGEITLVIAAPLKTSAGNSPIDTSDVAGGAFGAIIKLKK